ncbi:hypothetical protein Acr_17g0006590 [Actinidia rufa]|uniref:Uncharacterized protein n=1 Tax=Actinidia rufa TaxID=165716 RepID=A0A7J0G2S3_9ERIC|nr:hypothetical protein Acr_17g0006590 [Actinidia rufa]
MKGFEELSRDGVELVGGICFRDVFPSFGWVDVLTGKVKRLKDISKEVDDLLDKEIESYKCSKGNDDRSNSFAEILLQLQKEGIETDFTQDKLKATLMDMFVAATDTSSTTMEWALTELMKNPNEMKKTQEEFPGSASREDLDMNEVFGLNIHKKIPLQLVPMLHSFESLK